MENRKSNAHRGITFYYSLCKYIVSYVFVLFEKIDRSGPIPKLKFSDRDTYAGNKTKEYDDLAMKYLSYVLFVLVACSSVYSLMYETHKSWYSWILSSLTSCVYMFGKPINLSHDTYINIYIFTDMVMMFWQGLL